MFMSSDRTMESLKNTAFGKLHELPTTDRTESSMKEVG